MSIPVERPDLNGVVYSRDAIEKAFTSLRDIPICIMNDYSNEKFVIGHGSIDDIKFDDNNGECIVSIDGLLYFGGTCCTVERMENNVISEYIIDAVGFSC